jgi:hypothetical protein
VLDGGSQARLDAARRAGAPSVLDGFTPPDKLGGGYRERLILRLWGLAILLGVPGAGRRISSARLSEAFAAKPVFLASISCPAM